MGDVGQHTWEELNRVRLGGNYGWATTEGDECFASDQCDTAGLLPPHAQYRNTSSGSIVAGFPYRGRAMPELQGTVLYSDFYFGSVFAVDIEGGDPEVIGEGARGFAGWAEGDDGELYAVSYFDGTIHALRPLEPSGEPDRFPRSILETGCVDPSDLRRPSPGAIAYDVNHSFWSDGADKQRSVALPEGASATIGAQGHLDFPIGTVLVKSFFDAAERPIETRLFVHHDDDGWAGYTWAWNADGTDATFVDKTRTETVDGQPWVLPGPRDCMACHTAAAGRSLGLEVGQLSSRIAGHPRGGSRPCEPLSRGRCGCAARRTRPGVSPRQLFAVPSRRGPRRSLQSRPARHHVAGEHKPVRLAPCRKSGPRRRRHRRARGPPSDPYCSPASKR